ncbi:MAG: right-handed parallel beta-helix repeat-containing protein [Elusimicrobiota bacterium]
MALDMKGPNQIFKHSRNFDQGVGTRQERIGQADVIVAQDGTADAETIQDGVDLLSSKGGTVFIKEGEYHLQDPVKVNIDGTVIKGAGKATKIYTDEFDDSYWAFDCNADRLHFELLLIDMEGNFDNGGLELSGKYQNIEKCWFENGSDNPISLGDYSAVTNCYFTETYSAVSIYSTDNCVFSNNIVDDTFSTAIYISHGNNSTISGNIVINEDIVIYNSASRNVITGNRVKGGIIEIEEKAYTAEENLVVGNIADDITDNATDTLVANNIKTG